MGFRESKHIVTATLSLATIINR